MNVRLAANVSWLFIDVPVLDRIDAAAAARFAGVEILFLPDNRVQFERRLQSNGLELVLFNSAPGDWAGGERGLAAMPGRIAEFRSGIERALEDADAFGCPRVHAMAGLVSLADPTCTTTYLDNLAYAAERASEHDVTIVIEAINHIDIPGYALSSVSVAADIIDRVNHPHLRLQLDLYHHVMARGDPIEAITKHCAIVDHVQVAGVPGRHEPDRGELAVHDCLAVLSDLGYTGWVGCEYAPRSATEPGLAWARRYLHPGA